MGNVFFRYGSANHEFTDIKTVSYPNPSGLQFFSEVQRNALYSVTNRDLPSTEFTWEISGIQKDDRDTIWDLWNEPELTCGILREPLQSNMVCYWAHSQRR